MKKHATPSPRLPREIGLTAVMKTVRLSSKISGDFASSIMGKYLGTENYRNFFARMVFHMLGEERKDKNKGGVVHHTHVYHRYERVYQTVHSTHENERYVRLYKTVQNAPVFNIRYLRGQTMQNADRVHPVLQFVDGRAEIKNVRQEISDERRATERERVEAETLRNEIQQERTRTERLLRGYVHRHVRNIWRFPGLSDSGQRYRRESPAGEAG